MSSSNFVHDLDRCTSEIVSAIISAQSNADCVNRFAVPHTDEMVRVLLPCSERPAKAFSGGAASASHDGKATAHPEAVLEDVQADAAPERQGRRSLRGVSAVGPQELTAEVECGPFTVKGSS